MAVALSNDYCPAQEQAKRLNGLTPMNARSYEANLSFAKFAWFRENQGLCSCSACSSALPFCYFRLFPLGSNRNHPTWSC